MAKLTELIEQEKRKQKKCDKCDHLVDDHVYSWSGPWDWWTCKHCGCEIGH